MSDYKDYFDERLIVKIEEVNDKRSDHWRVELGIFNGWELHKSVNKTTAWVKKRHHLVVEDYQLDAEKLIQTMILAIKFLLALIILIVGIFTIDPTLIDKKPAKSKLGLFFMRGNKKLIE